MRILAWGSVGAVVLALIATRTVVLKPFVLPALERAIGCEVRAGRVILQPNGRLTITNLRLQARGVPGDAARFLRARKVDIDLDWDAVRAGAPRASRIVLHRPVVRLSQSAIDGRLNVQALASGPGSGAGLGDLPEIDLRRALLEFGEHDGADYQTLLRLPVEGEAIRRPDAPNIYAFRLVETDESAKARGRPPTRLVGEYDTLLVEGRVNIEDVEIAQWGDQWSPRNVRAYWRDMAIQGRIPTAQLVFDQESGLAAEFTLDGVRMTLPVAADPAYDADPKAATRRMTMRGVSGVVRFAASGVRGDFTGYIEDLRYSVRIRTDGLGLNAPFTIDFETPEPFLVAESPELLPFAPDIVRRRFRSFSGPTAKVVARVQVTREAPVATGPGRTRVAGSLRFEDGAAAYESFAYPFHQLEGLVRFSDEAIEIVYISGVGAGGSRLQANGRIAPPTDGSAVAIDIAIVDVVLDENFEAALPENRREILSALFDRAAHARLIERGLVQSSAAAEAAVLALRDARLRLAALSEEEPVERRDELARKIAAQEQAAAAHGFDLAGRADINIRIRRELGDDSVWTRDIDVRMPYAGILVRTFPYPVQVRDVQMRIDDKAATIDTENIAGLTGARGSMRANIVLTNERGEDVFEPDIVVHATGAPVDELLLSAIPESRDAELSAADSLRALGLAGGVSCEAHVFMREDGRTAFEVDIALDDLEANPGAVPGASALVGDLSGRMQITGEGAQITDLVGRIGSSPFTLNADAIFDDPERGVRGELRAVVETIGLDLETPVERVLGAIYPPAQDAVLSLRTQRRPEGVIDATIEASTPLRRGEEGATLRARVRNPRDASFDLLGGRVLVASAMGEVVYELGRIEFDDVRTAVVFDNDPVGDIGMRGALDLVGSEPVGGRIDLEFQGWRFESPLLRSLVSDADTTGRIAAALGDSVYGEFDGGIVYDLQAAHKATLRGEVRPRSLIISRDGHAVRFDTIEGGVSFEPGRGAIEGLRLAGESVRAEIDGAWTLPDDDGPGALELRINAGASSLGPSMRALLPEGARDAIDALLVTSDGPMTLHDGDLRIAMGGPNAAASTRFSGVVGFENASLMLGAPIERASGALSISVDRIAGSSRPDIDLALRFDALEILGVRVHDGVTRVVSGQAPGEFIVPTVEARSHGGRITGTAHVRRASGEDRILYDLRVDAAGIAFAPMLADLSARGQRRETNEPPAQTSQRRSLRRGSLDGFLSLSGETGDGGARIGRGAIRVSGGEVIRLPLLVNLIELSNLTAPAGDELDFALARYYIRDELLVFEELGVSSNAITIAGQGTIRWPELYADLRFNSRSNARIPVLSDLIEGLRDEFATITVTGPLADPQYGVTQLSGTRRLFDGMFGRSAERAHNRQPTSADRGIK
ncbi:MAG: hypothetical protein EA379_09280 [Phycisphaerales bacterium]|nr:MAG: hypothetical protein EA379_09280 [Phycisphaerales bacterium]